MSPKSFFDKIDRLSVNRKSTYEKLDPANIMDDDDGDLDCSTLVDPTTRRSKPDSIPSITFDRIFKDNPIYRKIDAWLHPKEQRIIPRLDSGN